MKYILSFLLFQFCCVSFASKIDTEPSLEIYRRLLNPKVSELSPHIYVHKSIKKSYTKRSIKHLKTSGLFEFNRKKKLPRIVELNQNDIKIEGVHVLSDQEINNLKSKNKLLGSEIWFGRPIFNKARNKAVVMLCMSIWHFSTGAIYSLELLQGVWSIKAANILWV